MRSDTSSSVRLQNSSASACTFGLTSRFCSFFRSISASAYMRMDDAPNDRVCCLSASCRAGAARQALAPVLTS